MRVPTPLRSALGAVTLVLAALAPAGAQETTVDVGVRPAAVRVGETFVVTVRVVGPAWPERVELDPGENAEVVESVDRSAAAAGRAGHSLVFERDFVVRALREGRLSLPPVEVEVGGRLLREGVPAVTAAAVPLAWSRAPATRPRGEGGAPAARDDVPRAERTPPDPEGRTLDATRWGAWGYPGLPVPGAPGTSAWPWDPYGATQGQGYGTAGSWGYGVPGHPGAPPRLPPGQGWAERAAEDPWWGEMVPELLAWQTAVDGPRGLVRLEAGLTPLRLYVGQQVTLVAAATFAPEAVLAQARAPVFVPPAAADAWIVDLPFAPPTPAAVAGRMQESRTFYRAYFPHRPGRLEVEGAAVLTPDEVRTPPLVAQVLPIPVAEAPVGWGGAVGRYRLTARLDPEEIALGETALLTVEVSGAGYLPAVPRPNPTEVWQGALRPLGERAWIEVRDGVVGGVKRFHWLVVPTEETDVEVGPVVFSYFDPWLRSFGQVATEEMTLGLRDVP